jgi:putative NADH-flavin reductase
MKLAILGGSGRTGRLVVADALARGHEVAVLVRDASRLDPQHRSEVRVVTGPSTDPAALADVLAGADAVISALGQSKQEPDVQTRTAKVLVAIMDASGPKRFAGISGGGVNVPGDQKGPKDKLIGWAFRNLGGELVKDKPAEYLVWAASDLDWTLARAPRLVNTPAGQGILQHDAHIPVKSMNLSRADLAAFLLDVVEQHLYSRQAPFIATGKN